MSISTTPIAPVSPTASSTSVAPPPPPTKLQGYDLYRAMGSPRRVLAPMVDASELAWRIFSRVPVAEASGSTSSASEGKGKNVELTTPSEPAESSTSATPLVAAELCYTPMINAKFFGDLSVKNTKIRDAFDLVTGEWTSSRREDGRTLAEADLGRAFGYRIEEEGSHDPFAGFGATDRPLIAQVSTCSLHFRAGLRALTVAASCAPPVPVLCQRP